MKEPPKTVFLDQNKWIDLAHAFEDPAASPDTYQIGCGLVEALKSGRLHFPLTSSLIIETYRMGNDRHRRLIAEVQSRLSQGRVFRDRNSLIRHEILRFFCQDNDAILAEVPKFWWMSKYFLEAFVDMQSAITQMGLEADQVRGLVEDPAFALFHWIATAPSNERESALRYMEFGAKELIARFEKRRAKLQIEKQSMHKRVYAATLAIEEQSRIISVCDAAGLEWEQKTAAGPKILKEIIEFVPSYQVELALACSIERLNRPINSNDLRDMSSYVAAIPNSDIIVGEKLFVNLARQGGLGKRYECDLHTDLSALKLHL